MIAWWPPDNFEAIAQKLQNYFFIQLENNLWTHLYDPLVSFDNAKSENWNAPSESNCVSTRQQEINVMQVTLFV